MDSTLTPRMVEAVGHEFRRAHLDLIAVAPNTEWLALSMSFLNAYGDAAVISELQNQLGLPSGMAWIWCGVRTSFANPAKVK
jgi:hypothetical protein